MKIIIISRFRIAFQLLLLAACACVPARASAQIAYDTFTDGGLGIGVTSQCWNHTMSGGSNPILFVGGFGDTSDAITGATFNSVSMTLVGKTAASGDRWAYLFYLTSPASGTHQICLNASSSIAIYGVSASYTGVSQTGIPDSSATNNNVNTTTLTLTLSPVADNTWAIVFVRSSQHPHLQSGSNGNSLFTSASGVMLYDSGAAITPAASWASTAEIGTLAPLAMVGATFHPAGATTTPCLRSLLGIGCEVQQ